MGNPVNGIGYGEIQRNYMFQLIKEDIELEICSVIWLDIELKTPI